MANTNRTVLYIGVTSNLHNRVQEHQNGQLSGFASRFNCIDLVYYEGFQGIEEAIIREKRLKKWKRDWKEKLIKEKNPLLADLSHQVEEFT